MKQLSLRNETFITLLESYREWLNVLGYAESTTHNLPIHLREFFHFLERRGHNNLQRVSTKLIQEYYTELSIRKNRRRGGGLSKAYLNKHQQALKLFLTYLKKHKANISFGVHLKGEKTDYRNKVILSQSEIKELFSACDFTHMAEHFQIRDRAILVLLYSCGLRRNEAMYVNCEDVLFEKQRIYVRKGKNYKERFVPINGYNLSILEEYLYDARPEFLGEYQTDALLLSRFGKRVGEMTLGNRLRVIVEATENEAIIQEQITPHTLRHSIATHLMQNNVPIKSISSFLGHSSMESTQIYTHLAELENEKMQELTNGHI